MVMDGKLNKFSHRLVGDALLYLDHLNDIAVDPAWICRRRRGGRCIALPSVSTVNVRDCTHMVICGASLQRVAAAPFVTLEEDHRQVKSTMKGAGIVIAVDPRVYF